MGLVKRTDGKRVFLPSISADLEHRHNLTAPEAERLFHLIEAGEDEGTSALSIKNERKNLVTPDPDPEPEKQGSVTRSSDLPGGRVA